jgi:hypothetical protein
MWVRAVGVERFEAPGRGNAVEIRGVRLPPRKTAGLMQIHHTAQGSEGIG